MVMVVVVKATARQMVMAMAARVPENSTPKDQKSDFSNLVPKYST